MNIRFKANFWMVAVLFFSLQAGNVLAGKAESDAFIKYSAQTLFREHQSVTFTHFTTGGLLSMIADGIISRTQSHQRTSVKRAFLNLSVQDQVAVIQLLNPLRDPEVIAILDAAARENAKRLYQSAQANLRQNEWGLFLSDLSDSMVQANKSHPETPCSSVATQSPLHSESLKRPHVAVEHTAVSEILVTSSPEGHPIQVNTPEYHASENLPQETSAVEVPAAAGIPAAAAVPAKRQRKPVANIKEAKSLAKTGDELFKKKQFSGLDPSNAGALEYYLKAYELNPIHEHSNKVANAYWNIAYIYIQEVKDQKNPSPEFLKDRTEKITKAFSEAARFYNNKNWIEMANERRQVIESEGFQAIQNHPEYFNEKME